MAYKVKKQSIVMQRMAMVIVVTNRARKLMRKNKAIKLAGNNSKKKQTNKVFHTTPTANAPTPSS